MKKNYQIPSKVILLIIGVCLLPTFLNLLGVDFGTPTTDFTTLGVGAFVHTLLEWSAVSVAIGAFVLGLFSFALTRKAIIPVLAVVLFFSGILDAFHTIASDQLITTVTDSTQFVPFTWTVSRLFNALIISLGIGILLALNRRQLNTGILTVTFISFIFGLLAYGIIYFSATAATLPQTLFPEQWISRPWDILPLLIYLLVALPLSIRFYRRFPSIFSQSLLISFIPLCFVQLHMIFGSHALFDNHFNIAHFLKIVAYDVMFVGLCFHYLKTYKLKNKAYKDAINAEKKAAIANQAKSQFLTNMSHEIRTPVSGVVGMCNLLMKTELTNDQRQLTTNISESAETLLTLIEEILELSKIEAQKTGVNEMLIDIKELVRNTGELLALHAKKKGLDFFMNILPNVPPYAIGDPAKIRQVINILTVGSIKLTKEGHISISLHANQKEEGIWLYSVVIKDTSKGIPISKREEAFEEFSGSSKRGTDLFGRRGLGLSIAKELTNQIGGTLSVITDEEEGTVFVFSIPLKVIKKHVLPKNLDEVFLGYQVLLIEPDHVERDSVHEIIQTFGMKCQAVDSQKEAFNALSTNQKFDIILLNHNPPETDATEFISSLRKNPAYRSIQCVVMTDLEHPLFEYTLFKPIYPSMLFNAFNRIIFNQLLLSTPNGYDLQQIPKDTFQNLKVLVVEDDYVNQLVLKGVLEHHGCEVEMAIDGEQAVELVESQHFDCVFMDCNMPIMDGYEATQAIRKNEKLNHRAPLYIVAITANALVRDDQECIKAGMDTYLTKPIHEDNIIRILKKVQKKSIAHKSH